MKTKAMPQAKQTKETSQHKKLPDPFTVTLVIPCYWVNQELIESTERCLLSYSEAGDNVDQLILVNDGSPKGMQPADYFTSRTKAQIVEVEANRGYTIAVNRGLAAATGDVIIIGNNDLFFTKGWLQAILQPLKQGYDISSIPTIEPNKPFVAKAAIADGDKFGALFAMTRPVLTALKGLDEDLGRGYFTDLDFQKRAQDAGFKDGKNYSLAVHHLPKSTFKVVDPEDKMYLESKEAFIKKYGKVW